MKAKTFENLIRKVVREEIDYALRREIKSLKEDLRDELKPTIVEHKETLVEVPNIPQSQPIPEATKASLREKIMGSNPIQKPQPVNKNFTKNPSLNALLNETAMGDTNIDSPMPPSPVNINQSINTPNPVNTGAAPNSLENVFNKDYTELVKVFNKKSNRKL
jgi:vancomycin resistance protein YoaR